jgi:hypothetical protein
MPAKPGPSGTAKPPFPTESSESGSSTVACIDVPRPPFISVAREQFLRDRAELLESSRGRFAAYHGSHRLKVVDSLAEGYEAGYAEHLPREQIAVFWIEEYESPQEIEFSAAAN